MRLETYTPSPPLRPFVKNYIIVECDEPIVNSMLPDTSIIMGLRFKGTTQYITHTENKLPFAVVAGLRRSIQLMKDEADTSNFLIVFHTAAVNAFIREPLHELFGEIASLQELTGFNGLNELEDRLCTAVSDGQRIQAVERFLTSRLQHHKRDDLVEEAVRIIRSQKGFIRVRELASRLYISIDALEKRFQRTTGASPKQFCYIVRMNAALHDIREKSLVETALDAGYYDQAHFTKDFKVFTGQSPTDFLKNFPS